jgi:[glutamine synthetase] adenylyltransferase / [glutamine synthetase]-adenylyl-L-tyrosine phosphorylase
MMQPSLASAISACHAGSPYLTSLLQHYPALPIDIAVRGFDAVFDDLCAACRAVVMLDEEAAGRELRHLKAHQALLIALADVSGAWDLTAVTRALTRFADAAVGAALDHLLVAQHTAGKLVLQDVANPSTKCGYTILAMGKHGAHELNYSSDIDLIILYDPDTAPLAEGVEPSTFFVKLTRKLVALLQDLTEDGYVFRVDLRLRPDPRATQVAIALEAAAIYYENQGQNWERAAMIKARACAGDVALGEDFLTRLKPYIWRKYLDFAAIADVQSLKRQMHAVKGHSEIAVLGHNLKLGRGGIREIEFFVQTQQLIAGGRNAVLRGRETVSMLHALAAAKWIEPAAAAELARCYDVLRMLEHRVQMQEDHQDHCVPLEKLAFERYAGFAGFPDGAALTDALLHTLRSVSAHYAALFSESDALGSDKGNLVFTGGEDDPGTISTLTNMGYLQPSEVSATIRGWHFGRYNATRSARAREILTELMPELLQALSGSGDPDQAFLAFDRFLRGLPSGVQLFSMLKANPSVLGLIANILGSAPRLAEQLSARPRTLEAFLEPGFFGPMPDRKTIDAVINQLMPQNIGFEDAMDRARELGRELAFRVGVRVLSDTASAGDAGRGYSDVAEGVIERLHQAVNDDMASRHGVIEGGASAVVAMGKLGGREMTAGSDLDLVVVYAHDADATVSDGARPLSPSQYFTRLTQRLVATLSAPTAEGLLYEVDMRLRPSGSKGPVAVSLQSFADYQKTEAWTWEKMALTRARVVSAPLDLKRRIDAAIATSLGEPRDVAVLHKDVTDMRRLMLREQNVKNVWDIKRKRGGLVEIEFIAQTLQLQHARLQSDVLSTNTLDALDRLAQKNLLAGNDAAVLREAASLYHRLTQLLRLCTTGDYDPKTAMPGFNALVVRASQLPDLTSLLLSLEETAAAVADIFDRLIGKPE